MEHFYLLISGLLTITHAISYEGKNLCRMMFKIDVIIVAIICFCYIFCPDFDEESVRTLWKQCELTNYYPILNLQALNISIKACSDCFFLDLD